MTNSISQRYRHIAAYEAISWRDRLITTLDREDLLEALYEAYRQIQTLKGKSYQPAED